MGAANPQALFEILCECFARAHGLKVISVTLKDKDNPSGQAKQI